MQEQQSNRIVIPGPLHPDFFDGETPIMETVEMAGQLYQVTVTWTEWDTDEARICVFAGSEAEACQVAIQRAEDRHGHERAEDFDAHHVEVLDRAPRDEELADYHERKEAIS